MNEVTLRRTGLLLRSVLAYCYNVQGRVSWS